MHAKGFFVLYVAMNQKHSKYITEMSALSLMMSLVEYTKCTGSEYIATEVCICGYCYPTMGGPCGWHSEQGGALVAMEC